MRTGKGEKGRVQGADSGDCGQQNHGDMGDQGNRIALVCGHPVGLKHEVSKGVRKEQGNEGFGHRLRFHNGPSKA
jgi:hypothetical protein